MIMASARYETSSYSSSSSQVAFMQSKDPIIQRAAQPTVTCVYQTNIAGYWRNVTVLWTKNMMNYSLSISVDGVENDVVHTCKIDLKPWHFWAKKGCKTFDVDGVQLEAYWDLKSAKSSGSPEPSSDFYVALVYGLEVVLLLGDCKKKAYKRTKARPALIEPTLVYKKENVFGKKSFSTRAKFDHRKREHDIVVESSTTGPKDPEMWISIDGVVLIHIVNLQWKFRGNRTVVVDKQSVEVFWDVYAWLFCVPGSDPGLFIFKSGESESDESDEDVESSQGEDSVCSGNSRYCSVNSNNSKGSSSLQSSLFLYAWKIE